MSGSIRYDRSNYTRLDASQPMSQSPSKISKGPWLKNGTYQTTLKYSLNIHVVAFVV